MRDIAPPARRPRSAGAARPRLLVAVVAMLVLALAGGSLGSAQASDERAKKRRVDARIDDLQHELNETSRELRRAAAALKRAESKLPGARARVAKVHGKLVAEQARDRALAEQLEVAKAEVARAKREIKGTRADIEASRVLIGRIARSSYQNGGMGELSVILDAQSPDDFATRLVLVQNTLRSENSTLADLAESRADLAAQKATLVAKRQQVAEMKREQEAVVDRIAALEVEAIEAQQAVESLIAERESAVAAVEREKRAEEARYAAMQAESARLARKIRAIEAAARRAAARAAARGSSSSSSGSGSGSLNWPVYGPVTSSYGMRTHPVTGIYKLHDGTDFGVGCGTAVHAAASGVVIQAANVAGYGNQLVLHHGVMRGSGVATSYSHLMSFTRGPGARVSRGDVIGYSGGAEGMYGAGYSTGCHLHFMVYVNGGTTDPAGWL